MKIISLSGLAGSGKSTVAKYFVEKHGYTQLSFAEPLKDVVAILFGWDRQLLEGATAESREWREQVDPWWTKELNLGHPVTPRWALQHVATQVMRDHFHQDIWLMCVKRSLLTATTNIVISDARFINELNLIQDLGGTMVGVYREIPPWLKDFYQIIDELFFRGKGIGVMSANTHDPETAASVIKAGKETSDILNIKLHESEWQHLLWPHYDVVIYNNSSLDLLYHTLENLA